MNTLRQQLIVKILDAMHYIDVVRIVEGSVASDVESFFVKGLAKVGRTILAKPYTKYGWLLAISNALGRVENDELIVYYNSEEPRWTAAVLIHEVTHLALDIKRSSVMDIILDETLAYTATFKSEQLKVLYTPGLQQAIELLSSCKNVYENHELINIVIPRILAHRLTRYNYQYLVETVIKNPRSIARLWLETKPPKNELHALLIALRLAGVTALEEAVNVDNSSKCEEIVFEETTSTNVKYMLEGVDEHFVRMLEILKKVAENKNFYRKILEPWWNELKDIEDYVIAFLELYSKEAYR